MFVFHVETPCGLQGDINVSGKHAVSIFRADVIPRHAPSEL
jgi:hypothetical protein